MRKELTIQRDQTTNMTRVFVTDSLNPVNREYHPSRESMRRINEFIYRNKNLVYVYCDRFTISVSVYIIK